MQLRKIVGHAPLLWAGAAVIIENPGGEILLHLRSDNNTWSLPGGAVDLGETLEDTAVREVFEETGLSVSSLNLFKYTSLSDVQLEYKTRIILNKLKNI